LGSGRRPALLGCALPLFAFGSTPTPVITPEPALKLPGAMMVPSTWPGSWK